MPEGKRMLTIFEELEQGTDEWLAERCGILTASVIGSLITTKTLKVAANDTSRALIATLAAERITGHVEPIQPSRDMERGTLDEPYAREVYAEHYAPVNEIGFMVREDDGWGFKLGYSPDGLVGDKGLIEIKSRNQKKQLQTVLADEVPAENMAQLQTGLFVSGREWIDYNSYCGGMPMWTKRVEPDEKWHEAILQAATHAEELIQSAIATYTLAVEGLPATERIDHWAPLELIF